MAELYCPLLFAYSLLPIAYKGIIGIQYGTVCTACIVQYVLYSMYSMYCTVCTGCTYALMYFVTSTWYLGPSKRLCASMCIHMHPYASVCIHMRPSRIRVHPYASIRLHTLPLRIQMSTANTHCCENVKKTSPHKQQTTAAPNRSESNPIYKFE